MLSILSFRIIGKFEISLYSRKTSRQKAGFSRLWANCAVKPSTRDSLRKSARCTRKRWKAKRPPGARCEVVHRQSSSRGMAYQGSRRYHLWQCKTGTALKKAPLSKWSARCRRATEPHDQTAKSYRTDRTNPRFKPTSHPDLLLSSLIKAELPAGIPQDLKFSADSDVIPAVIDCTALGLRRRGCSSVV